MANGRVRLAGFCSETGAREDLQNHPITLHTDVDK